MKETCVKCPLEGSVLWRSIRLPLAIPSITSLGTPIVSAVTARILELKATGALTGGVHDAIMNTASGVVTWSNLDPDTGISSGTTTGPLLKAMQVCMQEDGDDDDEVEN